MLTLEEVKRNPQINSFIKESETALFTLGYTNHGFRHVGIVAQRAREIAQKIGLSKEEQELVAIAGYCHDMGNFMTRTYHHYFGATLFHQVFQRHLPPDHMSWIMQAISNHDKEEMDFSHNNKISAVLVLADKSDVNRSRVEQKDMKKIREDIHNRVNYATTEDMVEVDTARKHITLHLKIDTHFVPIMEYFEIFTERMKFCRTAAEFLGYQFGIIINKTRLL